MDCQQCQVDPVKSNISSGASSSVNDKPNSQLDFNLNNIIYSQINKLQSFDMFDNLSDKQFNE